MRKTVGKAGFAKNNIKWQTNFALGYPILLEPLIRNALNRSNELRCGSRPKNPARVKHGRKCMSHLKCGTDFCCARISRPWRTACETAGCIQTAERSCHCRNMLPDTLEHVCTASINLPLSPSEPTLEHRPEAPNILLHSAEQKGLKHFNPLSLKSRAGLLPFDSFFMFLHQIHIVVT